MELMPLLLLFLAFKLSYYLESQTKMKVLCYLYTSCFIPTLQVYGINTVSDISILIESTLSIKDYQHILYLLYSELSVTILTSSILIIGSENGINKS